MSAPQLSDLIGFPGRNEIEDTLLAFTHDPDFAVTDWNSGGVMRTILELETEVIDDLVNATIPLMLAEGFIDTADGDWVTVLARGLYGLDRVLATVAVQTITVACAAGAGPYLFTVGTRFFTATDGRRYVNSTGGTLATSGTLVLDVSGESPGAALGLVGLLAPPLPGVTVIAAAIKIVATVPQYGSNDESDNALIARCLARWPSLTTVGTVDRVETWARAASTEVTRLRLDADPAVDAPGGVLVTVAGVSGAVSGGAVTAVQNYIDARAPITDWITAQNASNLTVTTGGTVTVPAARLLEIQTAADAAWIAYLASAQIGARVYRAELLQAVMDAGAIDVTGILLNAVAADLALAATQVPVPNGSGLAALLTWVSV